MKVVILAGGLGTRLSEATELRPKPMVQIGQRPILWHIMKIYSAFGYNEFIVLLGYKGYMVKEYFANYFLHQSDVTIDLKENKMDFLSRAREPWKISLIDTGQNTMTGGRIKSIESFVDDQAFFLTYGDGVANINLSDLLEHHQAHDGCITMTAVQPDGRFGTFEEGNDGLVNRFLEKPKGDGSWINGGFFVCEPKVFDYLDNDEACVFEQSPLQNMAQDGELHRYRHTGFWKCMDTLKDRNELDQMCANEAAPWMVWDA